MLWELKWDGSEEAVLISAEFAKRVHISRKVANKAFDSPVEFELEQYDSLSEEELDRKFGSDHLYDEANFSYDPSSRKDLRPGI